MNISNKYRAQDPIDLLIFEKGLRIKNLFFDQELDLLAIILNNGKILECRISDYPKLKSASLEQLSSWELVGGGIGVTWDVLDEDLSAKGFIKNSALSSMLRDLQSETINTAD